MINNTKPKLAVEMLDNLKKGCFIHYHYDRPLSKISLDLWRSRGYNPLPTGVCHVYFKGKNKQYTYPMFFIPQPPE